jgi:hypothetical protein
MLMVALRDFLGARSSPLRAGGLAGIKKRLAAAAKRENQR